MKKIIYYSCIVLSFLFISSCSNCEEGSSAELLLGTWQFSESYSSNGNGSVDWKEVEDGYTYTFNSDNTFTSNKYQECKNGTYSIDDDQIIFDFGCEDFTLGFEPEPGILVEQFYIDCDQMTLDPLYVFCIEGCGWRFTKID